MMMEEERVVEKHHSLHFRLESCHHRLPYALKGWSLHPATLCFVPTRSSSYLSTLWQSVWDILLKTEHVHDFLHEPYLVNASLKLAVMVYASSLLDEKLAPQFDLLLLWVSTSWASETKLANNQVFKTRALIPTWSKNEEDLKNLKFIASECYVFKEKGSVCNT